MKYLVYPLKLALVLILLLGACSGPRQQTLRGLIDQVENSFVPDSRVDQFNVQASGASPFLLTGETTNAEAKQALLDSLAKANISYIDSIKVLPSAELGDKIYGIVNNSVSNIRSEPRHSAQLATQALLGMPLQVLKKDGGWYYVRTPEDYLSWIDSGGMHRVNKSEYLEWKSAEKLIYLDTYGFAYSSPSKSSEKISDLAAGNILKLESSNGSYYRISYPDGREGFIPKSEATPFSEWTEDLEATRESLVQTARSMMGIPYLWGGTSTKGVDCSGFTKTIYLMNGMIIPRDASQQVHAGVKVDDEKNWDQLQPGDLLFFGSPATEDRSRRVVHVGMWIGDNQFIHSSRQVRISSVDSTASNYDAYNTGRYLESRRYLGNMEGNIIRTKAMYDEINLP
ncbi:NlpC/P60 family protein [Gracilimonas sp.]|uniref:C40 family peptidase n=1 Tax=Gracilimonas sp. TaxID=1974203 RepID=UPI003D0C1B73